MKVVIIGANGKIGRLVTQKMSASEDYEPTAFIRKEEQKAYFEDMGVSTIVESLENGEEDIIKALEGFDAVVFTAGSGGSTGYDKTMEIDLYGAIKSINAAKSNGIKRYIMVGAAFSDVPSFWQGSMKPYYIAKHLADKELKRSGLDYTILRPVRLTDDEEEGKIKTSDNPKDLNSEISRVAVAEAIVTVLPDQNTYGQVIEMSEGSEVIEKAVEAFV